MDTGDLTPHGFLNLGAREMPPDTRDYHLKLGGAAPIPEVYMPQDFFSRTPVYYQNQIPDCGANAGAFIAGYMDDAKNTYSPDYQWIDIKTFDGYALADGTDMRSIFKSLTKGSVPYTMLPEQTSLPLAQFSSTSRLTPEIRSEAPKHTVSTYAFHSEALDFATLKSLIYQNKAVILLVRIGDEFWTDKNGQTSWREQDILPLRTPTQVVSGHFVVAGAYDQNYIYFANWWSDRWGRRGYGYFGENYLPQITGVGTIVDSADKVVQPSATTQTYEQAVANLKAAHLPKVIESMALAVLRLKYGQ